MVLISVSNRPSVLGLVIMMPATSSVSSGFRASTSIRPFSRDFTSTTSRPQTAAEAGFVPWALSGTITLVRLRSPRLIWYCRMSIRPVSSPCAPAQGAKVNLYMPVMAARALSISSYTLQAPSVRRAGMRGCRPAKPCRAAISSLILGLYFMVQEPSG